MKKNATKDDGIKKLNKALSDILQISSSEITDESSPKNTLSWDSYNSLTLIAEIEKIFKINFKPGDVSRIKNVGNIKKLLRKHKIKI